MDQKQALHVMTLANSIIGVSILAMPYCFKQCGIILSILLLIISSIISRLACHFLLKSAIKARLKTFEFLAYHVFGSLGKLFVEIGLIGFLLGTCIAFFVVMGDLGPQIVAQLTETKSSNTLRTSILIVLAIFCVLPLGLLRNVSSLSTISTATVGFYACLVLKVIGESVPHIFLGDWFDSVVFWRPAGILQCIPIFSMALFCQTQLFEIYQAIPNASLEKMNDLVRIAVNICTGVYIFVGVFGYIAISQEPTFSGNILMNFKPSLMTEIIKIGFVMSVAFSFPLVIFPCRASLFSLLFKPTYASLHESSVTFIPENKFRFLTVIIISVSLLIGVMIPNIELVLGLVGSTIGVIVCVLFPSISFICIMSKNTNERILAQIMLVVGIVVMVLGTYANLYAAGEVVQQVPENKVKIQLVQSNFKLPELEETVLVTTLKNIAIQLNEKEKETLEKIEDKILEDRKEIRHEPPQPIEPVDEPVNVEKTKKLNETLPNKIEIKIVDVGKVEGKNVEEQKDKKVEVVDDKKADQVDEEAIKKEEKELSDSKKKEVDLDKQEQLVIAQQKILEEQRKLLLELKERQEIETKEKKKAMQNIEKFAKLAIESIKNEVSKDDKKIDDTLVEKLVAKSPEVKNVGENEKNNIVNKMEPLALALNKKINETKGPNLVPTKKPEPQVNILQLLKGSSNNIDKKEEANEVKVELKEQETDKKLPKTNSEEKSNDLRRKRDIETNQCEGKNKTDGIEAEVAKLDTLSLTRDLKSVAND